MPAIARVARSNVSDVAHEITPGTGRAFSFRRPVRP